MSRNPNEDRELWKKVTSTVKPLREDKKRSQDFAEFLAPKKVKGKVTPKNDVKTVRPYAPEPLTRINLKQEKPTIEPSMLRRISKGRVELEGRIDLHGMTQAEAYYRLKNFLENAHRSSKRTVLVITGKGVAGEGVLKTMVPRWLAEPDFRTLVSGHSQAHVSHGGSGALYVRLRSKSNRS